MDYGGNKIELPELFNLQKNSEYYIIWKIYIRYYYLKSSSSSIKFIIEKNTEVSLIH